MWLQTTFFWILIRFIVLGEFKANDVAKIEATALQRIEAVARLIKYINKGIII
jgi:hypothetical protein